MTLETSKTKANPVLQRIEDRDRQRRAEESCRRAQVDGDAQLAAAFLENLAREKARIDDLTSQSEGLPIESLAADVDALEEQLASVSYLLVPFDLRQATATIRSLRALLVHGTTHQKTRQRKFTFARTAASNRDTMMKSQRKEVHSSMSFLEEKMPDLSLGGGQGMDISGLEGETVYYQPKGEEIRLKDLKACKIQLMGCIGALFMSNMTDCVIVTGPIGGAVHIEGMKNCRCYIAARQVRIHSALDSDFYLNPKSGPVIEHSQGLRFAPYIPVYQGIEADFEASGWNDSTTEGEEWKQVQDFGWIRKTPSPNWTVISLDERKPYDLAN